MFGLPFWAVWIINLVTKLVGDWDTRNREAQANREAGAAEQVATSTKIAEKQEAKARDASASAQDGPDDPRDLRD